MSELLLAATVLAAPLGPAYFFCLRPMRRGRCAMVPEAHAGGQATAHEDSGAEGGIPDQRSPLTAATMT